MTPEQIIKELKKEGEMIDIFQLSKNEFQGIRKGKVITVKITKYRNQWQLTATNGNKSVPSNTFPWQSAIFDALHWHELD